MKKKLVPVLTSAICASVLLTNGAFAETKEKVKADSKISVTELNTIEKRHKEFDKIVQEQQFYLNEINKNEAEFLSQEKVKTIKELSLNKQNKLNEIDKEFRKLHKDNLDKKLEANGFIKVKNGDDEVTVFLDDPSDLVLTDNCYFDTRTQKYVFLGMWDFRSPYDTKEATWDIAAIRMNKNTYPIGNSSCYAYDNGGKMTGDTLNGASVSGSTTTKRFENGYGVVYNIKDDTQKTTSGLQIYATDHGQASMYFDTVGTAGNKIFFDFEHNYSTDTLDVSASFSGVNLTGSALTVTYSDAEQSYRRTSNGRSL
ncbi:hypothetical protein V7056_19030 [Bacillus sp. JJ664]